MALVYGQWDVGPPHTRKDTRAYFLPATTPIQSYQQHQGNCVGIIWMCNPGTQKPVAATTTWGVWPTLDNTMHAVIKILNEAQLKAKRGGPKIGDYVEILNLFYLCNSNVYAALKSLCPGDQSPNRSARFCWFAWGSNFPKGQAASALAALSSLSPRPSPFYLNGATSKVVYNPPSLSTAPAHPLRAQSLGCRFKIADAIANYI